MSEPAMPYPSPRIGDAERDRTVACLQEHHSAGRLDALEFDDRMGRALQARTRADVDALFSDLPAPHPFDDAPALAAPLPVSTPGESLVAPTGASKILTPQVYATACGVVWALAIILFLVNVLEWWVFLVPALLMPALAPMFKAESKKRREVRDRTHHDRGVTDGRSDDDLR